jgi:hypothetical protein
MHTRLIHDFVFRLAKRALSIIAPCLREEEHRDAFAEFYAAFKEEVRKYETDRERMLVRLGKISQVKAEHQASRIEERPANRGQELPTEP